MPGDGPAPVAADRRVYDRYQLVDTTLPAQLEKDEASLFDGVDTGVTSLGRFVSGRAPENSPTG